LGTKNDTLLGDLGDYTMNLVVGATGLVGGQVCIKLIEGGKPVRALVRPTSDRAKVEILRSRNIGLAQGDLKEPATLAAACAGITTVISTASSTLSRKVRDSIETVDRQGQLHLIEAARAAGVRHFIFVSFPPTGLDFPLDRAKRAVEQRLQASGLACTILWPTFFSEVWLSPALGFDAANAKARIYGSGQNKVRWISYLDVAAFGAACVDNMTAHNKVIPLGGPEALSPLQVVKIFEEAARRTFTVEHVAEEALCAQRATATDSLSESFAALMLSAAHGDAIDMTEARSLFPSLVGRLTSVQEYARRSLGLSSGAVAVPA
jgi:uncharacterized protein YbjT (DUF2867 family)